jgi:hypothetical protein
MKITSFNPIIVTSKSDDLVKLFEELGFEKKHHNEEVDDRHSYRMKDANGFHVDVVQNDEAVRDTTVIRMNVDNFDEAHDFLLQRGFKDGPRMLDKKSAKSMGMISPTGFVIGLIEHKKNHD